MAVRPRLFVVALGVVTACGLTSAWAHDPQGVSPGSPDRITLTESRCPTFSWETAPGAELFELVAYRLPDDADLSSPGTLDLAEAEEVLYQQVSGGAASWTPAMPECLMPGVGYVWFVRGVLRDRHGEAVPTEWSEGRFFSVAVGPTGVDAEEVVEVLRRYLAAGGSLAELVGRADPSAAALPHGSRSRTAATRGGQATDQAKSVLTAKTAIRGGLSDTTGEAYGVVGVSASADGAGLGAANTGGGPDLVLDGSEDFLPDAELSESGIDRPWGTPQTFNIRNSVGAGMTLQVDGVDALTEDSEIDADKLTSGTVPSGRLAGTYSQALTLSNPANSFSGSGAGLTGVDADTLDGTNGSDFATDIEAAALVTVHAASADHDDRYFTETQLFTSGSGAAVHWDNLIVVPPGFADGTDDDTLPVLPGGQWGRHTVTTVDSGGYVGHHSSITVDVDGLPIVSYYEIMGGQLKVARCSDLACSSATINTVDSTGQVGWYTSITVGADGLPIISYLDVTNQNLKVAHCSDRACSSATITTIDSANNVGYYTSITVGTDGLPIISYCDYTNHDLKVAHCSNVACTSAAVATVDSVGWVGWHSSITIGAYGLPVISYYDATNAHLKLVSCIDVSCSSSSPTTVDSSVAVGEFTSITIGADGLPVISYYDTFNGDLKVAHCNSVVCSSATVTTIDSTGDVGLDTSITVGTDGLPVISYRDATYADLKVAHCSDLSCTSAMVTTVDGTGDMGLHTSITIGADGAPVISYYDGANADLKVAHCSNPFCLPYARHR